MATAANKTTLDINFLKAKWISDLADLSDQLEIWFKSHAAKPEVRRGSETINESGLGSYEAPHLDVIFDSKFNDAITVEAQARNYPGRGVVKVIAWPTLRRIYLLQAGDGVWEIYTESDIPLRQPWTKENFHQLINDLRAKL